MTHECMHGAGLVACLHMLPLPVWGKGGTKVMSFCFLLVSFCKPALLAPLCIAFGEMEEKEISMSGYGLACLSLRQKQKPARMALGGDKRMEVCMCACN